VGDLIIAGPAPAPLARAETLYRYQILLRTRHITKLSPFLAEVVRRVEPARRCQHDHRY
jgi:primosomal protein N'